MPDMLKNIASKLPTLVLVLVSVVVAYVAYQRWTESPWTRDGQVRADIVKIAPRVSGYIVQVLVEDNQFVRKGKLLFKIDPSSYKLAVDTAQVRLSKPRKKSPHWRLPCRRQKRSVAEAEASVTSAKGEISKARGGVRSAAAGVDASEASEAAALAGVKQVEAAVREAQAESDRAQRLLKQRAGSLQVAQQKAALVAVEQAALDGERAKRRQAHSKVVQARASQDVAGAEVSIAENALAEAHAELASATASLAQAKATLGEPGDANVRVREAKVKLEEAQLNLSWTSMYAPFDGFITNLDVSVGKFSSSGTPIAAFVDSSSFRVDGYFQESKLKHVKQGDRAIITLMSHPDIELKGVVDSIGYAISPPDIADTEGTSNLVPQIKPTFDWVRLPQRVPVRIRLEDVPKDIQLISGTTASVAIRPSRED